MALGAVALPQGAEDRPSYAKASEGGRQKSGVRIAFNPSRDRPEVQSLRAAGRGLFHCPQRPTTRKALVVATTARYTPRKELL